VVGVEESGRSVDSTRLESTVDDDTDVVEVAAAQADPKNKAVARNIERDITSATLRRRFFPSVEAKFGSTGDVVVDVVLDLTADHAGHLELLVAIGAEYGNGVNDRHAKVGATALGGEHSGVEATQDLVLFDRKVGDDHSQGRADGLGLVSRELFLQ
jgi:hypothetical protein